MESTRKAVELWAQQHGLELVNMSEQAESTEQKFGQAEAANGDILYYPGDELVQGAPVLIGGPDGEVAPDGVHELADGGSIEIADGVIINVTPAGEGESEEEEQAAPVLEAPTAAAPTLSIEDTLDALAPLFTAAKKKHEDLQTAHEALKAEFATVKQWYDNQPAANPTEAQPEVFSSEGLTGEAKIKAEFNAARKRNQ